MSDVKRRRSEERHGFPLGTFPLTKKCLQCSKDFEVEMRTRRYEFCSPSLTSQGTFVGFYLETVKCKADEKLFKIMISGKNADTDSEAALTNITNVVKASGLKQGSIKSALRKAWKLAQEGNLERIDEIQRVSRSNGKKYAEIDVVPVNPDLVTGFRKARNPKVKRRTRRTA